MSNHKRLTVIVIVFNMRREAARTLYALTPRYQLGVTDADYDVLVIDHGSTRPLDPNDVSRHGPNFRYQRLQTELASPCAALNRAVAEASTPHVALMIDGARIPSPGILQGFLAGLTQVVDPFIYTLGMHLGRQLQNKAMLEGYDQGVEDRLLETVPWRADGYRLFDIAVPGGSYREGFVGVSRESNFICLARSSYLGSGGLNEGFTSPGAGLANLEFFSRLHQRSGMHPVLLLGEATFHQFHGGAATNAAASDPAWPRMAEEYRALIGQPYRPHWRQPLYLGLPRASSAALWRPLAELRSNAPALMVLGMHRSGTSCLAGMLQAAGFASGAVNEYAPNNRWGNREDAAIVKLNDNLLDNNGGAWDRPPAGDLSVVHEHHRSARAKILDEAAGSGAPWMFKDPRTLLTLPFWRESLPNPRRIGIFRHPWRVALSLYYRAQGQQPVAAGLELWTRYNERLLHEHARASFPIVCFDAPRADLMQHVRSALRSECPDLIDAGLLDLARLDDFYDAAELHQNELAATGAERDKLDRALPLYRQLCAIAGVEPLEVVDAEGAQTQELEQLQAADAAAGRGEVDSALALLRALAAVSHKKSLLWWRMIDLVKKDRKDPRLVAICQDAVADCGGDSGLWLELAKALRHAGQIDGALAAVDTAMRLRPGWREASLTRGSILNALGRWADAVQALRAGSPLTAESPWFLTLYAVALLRAGQAAEADEMFQLAVQRNPAEVRQLIHQQWAQSLVAVGEMETARLRYELALAAGPLRAELVLGCARLLQRLGRLLEAGQLVRQALDQGVASPALQTLWSQLDQALAGAPAAGRADAV